MSALTGLAILFDALAHGMVLFVISIGLSLMMGLMRVVNLAHGGFAMLGGFTAATLVGSFGWNYWLAMAVAVALTVAVAWPIEALLYRRLYRAADPFVQILTTIGLTFAIVGLCDYGFGPTLKQIRLPPELAGSIELGFRAVPVQRLFIIVAGLVIAAVLWLGLERTDLGIRIRASVDDADMAAALGVRTDRVYQLTFLVAVALAAFGGIAGAEILPLEPYYALRTMVVFLVVVSVGGAGSIAGALIACLGLGLVDATAKYFLPDYGTFFFYLAVVAIVALFPNGLLARAGR